jgi:hypothetical protein
VFDAVQVLVHCEFEIPLDEEAEFRGNREDLVEFHAEMGSRSE